MCFPETISKTLGPEESSLIKSIVWMNGIPYPVLSIIFKTNGSHYNYKNVPKKVAEELVTAESVGKYFNKNIKNKYEFEIYVPGTPPQKLGKK